MSITPTENLYLQRDDEWICNLIEAVPQLDPEHPEYVEWTDDDTSKDFSERWSKGVGALVNHLRAEIDRSALVWSSDYPKQSGLFWVRHHGQKKEIVSLTGDPGNLKQVFCGDRIGLHNLPQDWDWNWAGPIPEPQEPNESSSATRLGDGQK